MKTGTRFLKAIVIPILLVAIFAAEGMAYPSVSTGAAKLEFWRNCSFGSPVLSSAYPATIADTSAGGDPLVGSEQIVWIPSHPTQFDYRLVAEISSGVWTLSTSLKGIASEPLQISIGSASGATPYITGTVVAETIDFNKGVLNFGAVTNLQTQNENLLNSPVLNEFSQYATGTFSFEFATNEHLAKWVRNSRSIGSKTTYYRTTLTAVPEPQEWAMMLVGFTLIGFSIYRNRSMDRSRCR
ncbi:MAG: hypothetical protein C4530_16835 [Desulfobacteraceae bacterium]|nr:MAG: hypothetical protein C4530_16835 [Desulfobacteraceae bacterium]